MTNAMIILTEQIRLQKEGVLHYTGKSIKVIGADGEPVEIQEIQPIHTYQTWKSLGYQVKRGEKAIAKFPVWKYITKASKEETDDETEQAEGTGRMYMKMSAFFSDAQVEKMEVQ